VCRALLTFDSGLHSQAEEGKQGHVQFFQAMVGEQRPQARPSTGHRVRWEGHMELGSAEGGLPTRPRAGGLGHVPPS
ncbi:unnamed protein product, partial [Symbiodinium sp. CCMP2456]